MTRTFILILILFGILAVLEISNIIYEHRYQIKNKGKKIINKFRRKKNKTVEFD